MTRRNSFAAIVVGQNSLLREGVTRILRSANFRIAASVPSAEDLLTAKLQSDQTLFLIVHTGNDFGFVIEQLEVFKESHPQGRIAIVADRYRPDELVSAFRAGANAYFVDVITCDVFIRSIELVMMGETVLPPVFMSYVLGPDGDQLYDPGPREYHSEPILVDDAIAPQLSPREKLILHHLIEGHSNKSIARKIDIAEATVKVHVKAILRKIRVHNRTQAAIWGMNNGWHIQTTSSIAPPLSPVTPKQLPNPIAASSQIGRNDPAMSPGANGHDANDAQLPRIDRLIREDADQNGNIRPRK